VARGHEYFGLHYDGRHWIFREWAPHADALTLIGEMTGWRESDDFALERISEDGVWEIRLPAGVLSHGNLYRLRVHWPGARGDRIPAYARRVVQDPATLIFNAQVWQPHEIYRWRHPDFIRPADAPLIYEAHVGMAQEEQRIGTFREFTRHVLPRIAGGGYNTLQLMAIQEHPYYASFGYQVSSFFAVCSRFGTPDDLKALIDAAHGLGLAVIMDIIHSHAVANEVEGLSRFDGTVHQYFHDGPRGRHPAWNSRCFNYGNHQVLHFLLSNLRFWLDTYLFDGFRFDGITSMLYRHHGLGKAFTCYDDYFDDTVDEEADVYLCLANQLVHDLRPDAVTIAEDVSGMPGLALARCEGGMGFDYRFAMGVADCWGRLAAAMADEHWPLGHLWFELTNRRPEEKTISYAESHDQALVGDQTLIFRLIGSDMYDHMGREDDHVRVDRGMALHKMIRLMTLAAAGGGYLNFMGNEFGHPEWIDFPREGNQWSCRYARRQWHLLDDPNLKYHFLARFDRHMLRLAKRFGLLDAPGPRLLCHNDPDKVIAFERQNLLFVINLHPQRSHVDYPIDAPAGRYVMVLDSDSSTFGGHGRLRQGQAHFTLPRANRDPAGQHLSLYLPTRTAIVLAMDHFLKV